MAIDLKRLRDEILAEQLEGVAPAQERATSETRRANWGRIGTGLAEALSGAKLDSGYWDNIEQQGQRGLQDAMRTGQMKGGAMSEARQIGAAQTAAAKDAELDAPDSTTTQAYRSFYASAAPGLDVSKMTARQLQSLSPGLNKEIERRAEEAKAKNKKQDEADINEREAREWRDRNEITSKQALERARILAGQKGQEHVGKDLEGLASQKGDLEILSDAENQEDIPGVGLIDSHMPDVLDSPDATQTRQAILRTIQRISKEQSGTAISEAEALRIAKARGILGGTEQQFRIGYKALLEEQRNLSKAREAKYPAESVDAYKQRGGTTSADLPEPKNGARPLGAGGLSADEQAEFEALEKKYGGR